MNSVLRIFPDAMLAEMGSTMFFPFKILSSTMGKVSGTGSRESRDQSRIVWIFSGSNRARRVRVIRRDPLAVPGVN